MHHKLTPPSLLALLLAVVLHNIAPTSAFSTPTTSLLSSGSTRDSIAVNDKGRRNIILSYQSDPSLDDDEGHRGGDIDDGEIVSTAATSGRVAAVAAMGLLGAGVAQSVSQLHVIKVNTPKIFS